MRLTTTIPLALLAALTAAAAAPRAAQPRAASPLTIEQLIDIKHPSNPVWSRDSKRIAFTWERAGVANLYVVPADGSAKPAPLTTDGVPGEHLLEPRQRVDPVLPRRHADVDGARRERAETEVRGLRGPEPQRVTRRDADRLSLRRRRGCAGRGRRAWRRPRWTRARRGCSERAGAGAGADRHSPPRFASDRS